MSRLGEKIVIFGAGEIGSRITKILMKTKEILYVVDNDINKIGCEIEGVKIYHPNHLKEDRRYKRIIICVDNYSKIVYQLESLGVNNYLLFSDLYGYQFDCMSREIMDRNVDEYREKRRFTGKYVKNLWMNHLSTGYDHIIYRRNLFPGAKILDIGSGCGTWLFNCLLMDYDAYGIECCQWKLDFCNQKIDDFQFPQEWKKRIIFGYGENLQFADETFDVVTSSYVLEHVNDWRKCVHEMIRVTKNGGVMFINCPDYSQTFEPHYGIDIAKPIKSNLHELKKIIKDCHLSLDLFDELNFLTYEEMIAELNLYGDSLTIYNAEQDKPVVSRRDGKVILDRQINLIVKKVVK